MTCDAQRGRTVLSGEEGQIFREAILKGIDDILDTTSDGDSEIYGGASVFNAMSRTQQAASIEAVTNALFHETEECFPLTAWSEATLASILAEIKVRLVLEIDTNEECELRNFLRANFGSTIEHASKDWNSQEEWNLIFDVYQDQLLWDMDYESTSTMDTPPEAAAHILNVMGIDDDYYMAIPPDLEDDWELTECYHRVVMSIDGKKTIKMRVYLIAEVPVSMEFENNEEWGDTIGGFCPSAELFIARGDTAETADDNIIRKRFGILTIEHSIEDVRAIAS